jgi:hypothetical protein
VPVRRFEEMDMQTKYIATMFLGGLLLFSVRGKGQAMVSTTSREVDLSVAYNTLYRNTTTPKHFWEQGGSLGLNGNFTAHWGGSMQLSAEHAKNIAGAGYDLTTITTVFGPRYTIQRGRLGVYGEALGGESHGFDSFFPHEGGALDTYDSAAWQAGGGVDWHLSSHFAVRALQASWLRTYFPNAGTNVQNSLQVGAGLVVRLAHSQEF